MIKKVSVICVLVTVVFFCLPKKESQSWGFYGHKRINRMAVFTLPPEMVTVELSTFAVAPVAVLVAISKPPEPIVLDWARQFD